MAEGGIELDDSITGSEQVIAQEPLIDMQDSWRSPSPRRRRSPSPKPRLDDSPLRKKKRRSPDRPIVVQKNILYNVLQWIGFGTYTMFMSMVLMRMVINGQMEFIPAARQVIWGRDYLSTDDHFRLRPGGGQQHVEPFVKDDQGDIFWNKVRKTFQVILQRDSSRACICLHQLTGHEVLYPVCAVRGLESLFANPRIIHHSESTTVVSEDDGTARARFNFVTMAWFDLNYNTPMRGTFQMEEAYCLQKALDEMKF
jgi:hypothetical protein